MLTLSARQFRVYKALGGYLPENRGRTDMVQDERGGGDDDFQSPQGEPVPPDSGRLRQGEEDSLRIEEAPELDEEDDAILDRIWDNLPPGLNDDVDDDIEGD